MHHAVDVVKEMLNMQYAQFVVIALLHNQLFFFAKSVYKT